MEVRLWLETNTVVPSSRFIWLIKCATVICELGSR